MPDFVVVFGPNGEEETHTVLNARDLVLHVKGWTYGNGKAASPVDSSPYAMQAAPTKNAAQGVLDRYGNPNAIIEPPAPPVIFKAAKANSAPEPVYVSEAVPEVVEAVEAVEAPAPVEAPAEVEAVVEAVVEEAAPTGRQQRAPKNKG